MINQLFDMLALIPDNRQFDYAHYTGIKWLLTPVKPWYFALDQAGSKSSWYFLEVWQGHYLDIRVLVVQAVLLALLLVVVPYAVRNTYIRKIFQCLGFIAALILVVYPLAASYSESWIWLITLISASGMMVLSVRLFGFPLHHGDTSGKP